MSKAINLLELEKKVQQSYCSICNRLADLHYGIENNREIKFCGDCYMKIPEHIPLSQDSLYIKQLMKEKGYDTEKRSSERNKKIF